MINYENKSLLKSKTVREGFQAKTFIMLEEVSSGHESEEDAIKSLAKEKDLFGEKITIVPYYELE